MLSAVASRILQRLSCDTKTRRNTRRLPDRRLVRKWNSHKTPSLGHIEHLFSSAPQYPHAKVPRRVLIRSQSIGQAIYRRCRGVLLVKSFAAKAVMAAYGSEIPSTDTRRSLDRISNEQTCHPSGVPGLLAHFGLQIFLSLVIPIWPSVLPVNSSLFYCRRQIE